jgi:uncharacterized repeat protein (TIGR01451 family)
MRNRVLLFLFIIASCILTSASTNNNFLATPAAFQQRAKVELINNSQSPYPLLIPCFSAPEPQWRVDLTLKETGGVSARLLKMKIRYLDDNQVPIDTEDDIEGSELSRYFSYCGSDGLTIPANGQLCGAICLTLGGRKSGLVALIISGVDNNNREFCVTMLFPLLGSKMNSGADLSVTNVGSTSNYSQEGFGSFGIDNDKTLFTISIKNDGPEVATDVTLIDDIPLHTTIDSVAATSLGQYRQPTITNDRTITINFGSIPPGASAKMWLVVKIRPTTFDIHTHNRVQVLSNVFDPNLDNNVIFEPMRIQFFPSTENRGVSLTYLPPIEPIIAGKRMTYSIRVEKSAADPFNSYNVGLFDIIPEGTTLASLEFDPERIQVSSAPPIGDVGTVIFRIELQPGNITTIRITVNVLSPKGTTLTGRQGFVRGSLSAKFLGSGGCVPLQVPTDSTSYDTNFLGAGAIAGGGIISLTWLVPASSAGDLVPSPRSFSQGSGSAIVQTAEQATLSPSSSGEIVPSADACVLIGYKLYISSDPTVINPSNVWKMLPPNVASTNAPLAPEGSFYSLAAVYRCPDGSIRDSQPSNIISVGLLQIASVFREGKHLIVQGAEFVPGTVILKNGEPIKTVFESPQRVFGKKAGKTIVSGDRIQVRKPDGALSNVVIYP